MPSSCRHMCQASRSRPSTSTSATIIRTSSRVSPTNAIPACLRTMLWPPSQPTSQRAVTVSASPRLTTIADTASSDCSKLLSTVQKSTASGRNVRGAGIDFKQGDTLLAKGRRLSDRDLMLAAAMNYPRLAVHRSPHVAVLGSGDELIMPGGTLKPGEIVYSNGFALSALVRAEGGTVTDLGIARDDLDDIAGKIRRARDAGVDILLTSGGASVGDHDLMQKALKAEGLDLSFWRVALRPGRPMMHGRFARDGLGAMHVLGVPGNPVSSYVCAFLFLTPLIRTLSGRSDVVTMPEFAILGRDLPENDERADYLRATLESGPDGPIATPVPVQDSSLMAPLARAGGLLIREPFAPAAKAGERCRILKFAF